MSISIQTEAGTTEVQLYREHGTRNASFCEWRSCFDNEYASMMTQLKQLKDEIFFDEHLIIILCEAVAKVSALPSPRACYSIRHHLHLEQAV